MAQSGTANKGRAKKAAAEEGKTPDINGGPVGVESEAAGLDARSATPGGVRIGVISDTHGYLDPRVTEVFAGVDHIIHAGDIADQGILAMLSSVAPLTAVSGNIDSGELASDLCAEATGEVAGVRFVVAHKPKRLMKRLAAGKISFGGKKAAAPNLVVWGHVHAPSAAWIDGVLHLNPGTATAPYEEDDDPTVAIVEVVPAGLAVRFVPLSRRFREDAPR